MEGNHLMSKMRNFIPFTRRASQVEMVSSTTTACAALAAPFRRMKFVQGRAALGSAIIASA